MIELYGEASLGGNSFENTPDSTKISWSQAPVYVGLEKYSTTNEVFERIKAILAGSGDSEEEGGSTLVQGDDLSFMLAVFNHHPSKYAVNALGDVKEIVVKPSSVVTSSQSLPATALSGFYLIKNDGTEVRASYVKCLANLPSSPVVTTRQEHE